MLKLRPAEELFPRLDLVKGAKVLAVDGPNIAEGHIDAHSKSGIELPQVKDKSYNTIFAWFTGPDEKHAVEVIKHSARILTPGGAVWLIVPKKNSVEIHKATGIYSEKLIPQAEGEGLVQKKTLGIGPHYFAIKMQKHG